MSKVVLEMASILAVGAIGITVIELMKTQTKMVMVRIDEFEKSLATDNTSLGYGMEKLATVEHIEQLQKSIKKELSKKKTKKSKAKRRRR